MHGNTNIALICTLMSQGQDEKLWTVILNFIYQATEVLCTTQITELTFLSSFPIYFKNHAESSTSEGYFLAWVLQAQRSREQIKILNKILLETLNLPNNRVNPALFLFQFQIIWGERHSDIVTKRIQMCNRPRMHKSYFAVW